MYEYNIIYNILGRYIEKNRFFGSIPFDLGVLVVIIHPIGQNYEKETKYNIQSDSIIEIQTIFLKISKIL